MRSLIPLSIPNFEGNESLYVNDALSQGWVSTGGAYVTKLEERLSDFLHVSDVAVCQSGTAAIHLALRESGVSPGDLVIVPTLTFIAAVNPVRYQFADPVFMDCDDSLCIDPIKVKRFCEDECIFKNEILVHKESNRRVRAIVVVHVFGNMVDMESIMDIALKYKLKVVEDATEALGTRYLVGRYKDRFAGTIGDYGAFSFNGNKIITTGGGGAITAKTAKEIRHLRYLSTQAKDDIHYYVHNEVGFNYRMTNLQAALGVAQMEELPEFIRRKNRNYSIYKKFFEGYELAKLMPFRFGTYSNEWFYSLAINRSKVDGTIREIIVALEKEGVQSRAIWGLIHEQLPYKNSIAYRIKKAPFYADCIVNLPCSTQITEGEIIYVAKKVKLVLNQRRKSNGL